MPTQRQEKQSTKSDMGTGKGGLIEGVSMEKEFSDVEFFRGAER